MATPRHAGSTAMATAAAVLRTPCVVADRLVSNAESGWMTTSERARATAPAISHFSCWRRSPEDRRQLMTWAAANDSQYATSRTMNAADAAANHPAGWSTTAGTPFGVDP